jgi:tetratricopeptide (TPR) repeat protein
MTRLSSLSLPDSEDVASILRDTSSELSEEDVVVGVSAASAATATPLAVALPVLAKGIGQEKGVELLARTDQRISEKVDELDEEQRSHRCLASVLRGVSTLLPQGEQYSDPSLRTAEGKPENLASLFQTYQNEEEMEEVERAIERVLAGDVDEEALGDEHDDFVDHLRDAFGVETRDEALAMFLDFRELIQAREVHETLEAVHDIRIDVEEVEAKIDDTRDELAEKLDAILEAEVKTEGFERLSPHYFDGYEERADPVVGWRAGFRLDDVRAGYALDREKEIDGERQLVAPHLIESLLGCEDRVVLGLPGSGKSTILKSVACRWYEQQHGTVFYRRSRAKKQFDEVGPIENAIDDAEGHVLVVVEDAARSDADAVFGLREKYEDDSSVSFLLDSRMSEWQKDDYGIADARRGESKGNIKPFYAPQFDPENPKECERAVRHFERTTGVDVDKTPEQLYREIETNLGAGEMYLLGYRLSAHITGMSEEDGEDWTGLETDIRSVYNDLLGKGGEEDRLAFRVGLLFAVLTAAEVEVYREYIGALAESEKEYGRVLDILDGAQGRLHYGRDDTGAYRTNHPLWAMLFLEEGLNRGDEHEEMVVLEFEKAVNALFRFLGDGERREEVNSWMRTEFSSMESPDDQEKFLGDRVALSTFGVGFERPVLAPLFGTTEQSGIELPDECLPSTELSCVNARGVMFMKRGSSASGATRQETTDMYAEFQRQETGEARSHQTGTQSDLKRAEEEFEHKRDLAESKTELSEEDSEKHVSGSLMNLGNVAQNRGNLDTAEKRHKQAKERFDEIGDERSATKCLMNLGRVAQSRGNLDTAEERLEQAKKRFDEIGDEHSATMCLMNLGMVAQSRGNLDTAEERFKQAKERFDEIGDEHSATMCLMNLGMVAQSRGNLDTAGKRLKHAKERFEGMEDTGGVANSTANLGRINLHRGRPAEAESYYTEARELFEGMGDRHMTAMTTDYLGEAAQRRGDYELACERFEEALEMFLRLGIPRDALPCLRSLRETYDEMDDQGRIVEGLNRLVEVAERNGQDELASRLRNDLADLRES